MNTSPNIMQAMIDGLSAAWQRERAATQMTLGGFIAMLRTLPPTATLIGLGPLGSYRGYYSDLAFTPDDTPRTVAELLAHAEAAMGAVFEGYKGGDFVMGALTPLWVSEYGEASGQCLMGLTAEAPHRPVLAPEDDEACASTAPLATGQPPEGHAMPDARTDHIERLREENARLRAALEWMVGLTIWQDGPGFIPASMSHMKAYAAAKAMQAAADAALRREERT